TGTHMPNVAQQDYFSRVATEAVLPLFARSADPFLLVFWSRDPDGTQHNEGDSNGDLVPGINGPTSLGSIRNADDDLGRILAKLDALGLAPETDVVVVADHGFSTISKESKTSPSLELQVDGYPAGTLPLGFLAFDLLRLRKTDDPNVTLFDPDDKNIEVA